ncbi:hypothetical protein BGZ65_005244, partial [Modicella reniformis]
MPPTHPLELPEVLLHIAAYLPQHHRPSCALVSKTWNQVLTPLIWKEVKYQHGKQGSDAIQRHRHLIKLLTVDASFLNDCGSMRFPNIESLSIESGSDHLGMEEFISEHPFASLHMTFWDLDCQDQPNVWDRLLVFNNLKSLRLNYLRIDGTDTSSTWQLCMRLERLKLEFSSLRGFDQSSTEFSRIKELTLFSSRAEDGLMRLELVKRCPHLTTLIYISWDESEQNRNFFHGFARLLPEGTWPDFKAITAKGYIELYSNEMSAIIRGMKQIHVFQMSCVSTFEPHHMDLLRPHLDTITEIDLSRAETCDIAQEILSSSPMLKRFRAARINGTDVAKGQPWVCLGLEELEIEFILDPSTIYHVQPLVFDQLRRLSVFTFRFMTQRMGMEEIEWMLQHWRSLAEVGGKLNRYDYNIDNKLRERLQDHGINCIEDDQVEWWARLGIKWSPPLIWKEIKQGSDAIQRHRHLIKTLDMDAFSLESWGSMRFPYLESLRVTTGNDDPGLEDFISEHPSASLHMVVWDPGCRDKQELWSKLLGFNNLKSHDLKAIEIDGTDTSIWQLCTRLERLEFHDLYLEGFNQSSTEFYQIKDMTLSDPKDKDGSHDLG